MLYQKINNEYHLIQQKIQSLKDQITKLPEGKLICSRGNNCYKWYRSDGNKKEYLPKKERKLSEKIAIKK